MSFSKVYGEEFKKSIRKNVPLRFNRESKIVAPPHEFIDGSLGWRINKRTEIHEVEVELNGKTIKADVKISFKAFIQDSCGMQLSKDDFIAAADDFDQNILNIMKQSAKARTFSGGDCGWTSELPSVDHGIPVIKVGDIDTKVSCKMHIVITGKPLDIAAQPGNPPDNKQSPLLSQSQHVPHAALTQAMLLSTATPQTQRMDLSSSQHVDTTVAARSQPAPTPAAFTSDPAHGSVSLPSSCRKVANVDSLAEWLSSVMPSTTSPPPSQSQHVDSTVPGRSQDVGKRLAEEPSLSNEPTKRRHVGLDTKTLPDSFVEPPCSSSDSLKVETHVMSSKIGSKVSLRGLQASPELNNAQGTLESFDKAKNRGVVCLHSGQVKAFKPENIRVLTILGKNVQLHSLEGATELNGVVGVCEKWECNKNRWTVRLQNGQTKSLKPENLELLDRIAEEPTLSQAERTQLLALIDRSVRLQASLPHEAQGTLAKYDEDTSKCIARISNSQAKAFEPGHIQSLIVPGGKVQLHSLEGAAELNGIVGVCEKWESDKDRWTVRLQNGQIKSLKPDNLQLLDKMAEEPTVLQEDAVAGRQFLESKPALTQERLREIFQLCDLDDNGVINKREMIRVCRANHEVAGFLGLPQIIRQEDESRVLFERLFSGIDQDCNREITWPEFLAYFRDTLIEYM